VLGVLLREIQKIIARFSHNCSKKFVLGTTQYLCGYWCVPFRFSGQVNTLASAGFMYQGGRRTVVKVCIAKLKAGNLAAPRSRGRQSLLSKPAAAVRNCDGSHGSITKFLWTIELSPAQ
jgi:hypothetical protein